MWIRERFIALHVKNPPAISIVIPAAIRVGEGHVEFPRITGGVGCEGRDFWLIRQNGKSRGAQYQGEKMFHQ